MKTFLEISIPILTFLMMVIVGLDLHVADLTALRQRKRLVAAAALVPTIVHPLTTLLLTDWLGLAQETAAGIAIIAACPGGALSNVYTVLARGNVALSVVMTALACLMGLVTTPSILLVISASAGASAVRPPVVPLLSQLLLLLVLPVAVGFLLRRRSGSESIAVTRTLRRAGMCAVVATIIIIFLASDSPGQTNVWHILASSATLTAAWFMLGYAVAWGLAADARDRMTMGFQFAVRAVGIAIAIAVGQLGRIEFAYVAACFLLVQLPLLLAGSWVIGRCARGE